MSPQADPDTADNLNIRPATGADFEAIWPVLRDVFRAGDTYAVSPDITRAAAHQMWIDTPRASFVVMQGGVCLGTYYIKTNQQGGGDHVCNCGYVVAPAARGQGLAARLCAHSQEIARQMGYLAMQFNFVVSTNTGAIRIWERMGFDTVGRLPRAFRHPDQGLVDALVMMKQL